MIRVTPNWPRQVWYLDMLWQTHLASFQLHTPFVQGVAYLASTKPSGDSVVSRSGAHASSKAPLLTYSGYYQSSFAISFFSFSFSFTSTRKVLKLMALPSKETFLMLQKDKVVLRHKASFFSPKWSPPFTLTRISSCHLSVWSLFTAWIWFVLYESTCQMPPLDF